MATATAAQTQMPFPIAASRALEVAEADALRAYGDLSPFRVQIRYLSDGWHIDYELDDPRLHGGGPHYVIDATNGRIVTKRYEQ